VHSTYFEVYRIRTDRQWSHQKLVRFTLDHGFKSAAPEFGCFRNTVRSMISLASWQDAQFVQIVVEVGGVAENPKRTCPNQLVLAVAAAQQSDAEHPGPAGGHHPRSAQYMRAQKANSCYQWATRETYYDWREDRKARPASLLRILCASP